MEEKKIVIDINSSGEMKAETFGMYGIECVNELNKLLKDLALIKESTKKPEYYKEGRIIDNKINAKNS